jgi:hypothetical protein
LGIETAIDLGLEPIGHGADQERSAGVARHLRAPQPAPFRLEFGPGTLRQSEDSGGEFRVVLWLRRGTPAPRWARARGFEP